MNYFFKHKKGYININDDNLYFTKNGNWSEVTDLTEKTKKTHNLKTWKSFFKEMIFYVIVILIANLVIEILDLQDFHFITFLTVIKSAVLLTFGIVEILFKFPTFKIPLQKIQKIQVQDEADIKIYFENKDGKIETTLIQKMEKKGIKMIKSIL
ncbi:MAG: hypothetical protein GY827_04270 [Cytophagales bacterium]|nr:hypothetical protein [Cytophagales bacterium]